LSMGNHGDLDRLVRGLRHGGSDHQLREKSRGEGAPKWALPP
jgi:hypothetical protein